ncbi:16S rRNA (guanine(527)-N(7))-methyltransferase RsmG [Marinimicrococcus flavescens]|uniref:Ribosomal RNA small subunit methyltransferase G n=1 Tax=Marinimicrococcus flavescens TaxID=3031815 RepID=A0AAP4D534_9PROT|nr:16S rRNA (guanine(527)-N(7))-methyltransferase RsmG [Marinimicrococcus flavescens]
MGREGFARRVPAVSRETLDRLEAYLALLARWQRAINLVGPSTLADPWRRHLLDSAQLAGHWPEGGRVLVDLGSGAGLPGLILAAMAAPEAHLVESDQRKAAFLREAARALGVAVQVHACRIEAAPPIRADAVSARALAALPQLLSYAERFIGPGTRCLFLKGRNAEAELTDAREHWMMRARVLPSMSAEDGRIILLDEVTRAGRS